MIVGAATGKTTGAGGPASPSDGTSSGGAPAAQTRLPAPAAAGGAAPSSGGAELEFVRRAQGGDRAAFGSFVVATQDRLYTVLVRIVGDREEARELAQETYLKAFSSLEGFRGDSAPYTWLYRIAVNLAIARLRKVRRHRVFSMDTGGGAGGGGGGRSRADPAERSAGPEGELLAAEEARQVVAALGRLDSEYRTVLVLRDVDQLEYREIADVLQLPVGTVKSRLFRARLALREELQKYMNVDPRKPRANPPTPPSSNAPADHPAEGRAST